MINIEVKDQNKKQDILKKIQSKAEDVLLWLVEHLPEKMTPRFLMNWFEKYLNRRKAELEREIVKANWNKTYLEIAVNELHEKNGTVD